MPKKLTIDEVRKRFKLLGLVLLENEYVGNSVSMKYKCSCGHISTITVGGLGRHKSCFYCAMKKRKHPIEFVIEELKKMVIHSFRESI